jgi:hypothetical protein
MNVLRSILEPKMEEVRGGWINLHYEELHDLDIRRVISSRMARWACSRY